MWNGNDAVETMSPWCSGYHICLTRRRSAVRARVVTKVLRRSESLWISWTLCINATEFSSFMSNGNDAVETMSPWCSDYHICLTRKRSAVRARVLTKVLQGSKVYVNVSSSAWTQQLSWRKWNGLASVEMHSLLCKRRDFRIYLTCRISAVRARGDKNSVSNESIRYVERFAWTRRKWYRGFGTVLMLLKLCHHGVVVITSALHAEGPRCGPGVTKILSVTKV